jgi:GNAT superfamily N-acetyltransferase
VTSKKADTLSSDKPKGNQSMALDRLRIEVADPYGPEAQALIAQLDSDLRERYPAFAIHGFDPASIAGGRGAFVIAWLVGQPVGCGAIRLLEPGVGEVKRMFTCEGFRGRGIAGQVLAVLEAEAVRLGWNTVRLETGTRQPESMRVYERAGYVRIGPYGEYVGDPFSVCYEKRLG